MAAAMAIFGTIAPFVRNIPVSSGELALYRAVLAAVMIGLFLLVTKQKISFANMKKEVPLLLASGIALVSTGSCCFRLIGTQRFPWLP